MTRWGGAPSPAVLGQDEAGRRPYNADWDVVVWWLTFKYLSALSPSGLQELPLPTLSLSTLHSLTLASTIRKRQGLFIRLPHPKLAKEHFPGMQPLLHGGPLNSSI